MFVACGATAAPRNAVLTAAKVLVSCSIFRDADLAILAVIAKQERIRRLERAAAAIAKLRRQGTAHLGRLAVDRSKARKLHTQGRERAQNRGGTGCKRADGPHRIVR